MSKYILKRLLWMIPVLLGVAIVIFSIMYFVPGDPATIILGSDAEPAAVKELRAELGLDDPYLVRLGDYLGDVFLRFDFGKSYMTNVSISSELISRLPRTALIGLASMILSLLIGIPLGIISAVNRNGLADRVCMVLALVGISMPGFWLALMMVMLFSIKLGWLPQFGIGGIEYYILPVICNSLGGIANMARQARSSMLDVIRSDYIVTARAKGLSERAVIFKHALPNALIPIITIAGANLARIFGGSVVIENVFSIPGVGNYMVTAINSRDYPVVMGCVIFLAFVFAFVMILVDVTYASIDPRIKAQYTSKKRGKVKRT